MNPTIILLNTIVKAIGKADKADIVEAHGHCKDLSKDYRIAGCDKVLWKEFASLLRKQAKKYDSPNVRAYVESLGKGEV